VLYSLGRVLLFYKVRATLGENSETIWKDGDYVRPESRPYDTENAKIDM